MIEYISFPCPKCRSRLRASLRFIGHSCNCPRCGELVQVRPKTPAEESSVLVLEDGDRTPRESTPWKY